MAKYKISLRKSAIKELGGVSYEKNTNSCHKSSTSGVTKIISKGTISYSSGKL
jgi:hypothetical protein